MSILCAEDGSGERVPIGDYKEEVHKGNVFCRLGHQLIAKRGEKVAHHYAHAKSDDETVCSNHSNKGPWHVGMQDRISVESVEIPFKDEKGTIVHIADALCDGRVIEFQFSPISCQKIRDRENFYVKEKGYSMCWVFCCDRTTTFDFKIEKKEGDTLCCKIRAGPKYPFETSVPTYIDFGDMDLLKIIKANKAKTKFACTVVRLEDFDREWFGTHAAENRDMREDKPFRKTEYRASKEQIKRIVSSYVK